MTKTRKFKITLLAIVLIISCFLTCFDPTTILSVSASSIQVSDGYTNVLEDLQKDTNFDANDYVVNQTDYSLQVIQIAESNEKELFVYVYQPSASYENLRATTINISKNLHNKLDFKNYKLTLLNYSGVFYKYIVNDFVVDETETRYYEIASIFRAWDSKYDAESGNDNTITEVSFKVAKQYTMIGNLENTTISVADTEVITITDKYVGFVRYEDGFYLTPQFTDCDSHFVAFNTDKKIDKLFEADIYYTSQTCDYVWVTTVGGGQETTYGDINENYSYLNYQQNGSHTTNGIGGHTYTWKRISTVDEFIANENRDMIYECGVFNVRTETKMTDSSLENLKGKQWVLRFTETEYEYGGTSQMVKEKKIIVGNVTILRLSFETDGIVYNLGVVDNKQSGDSNPDNETTRSLELSDIFKIILIILLLILLLIVLGPILPTIFNVLFAIIKILFKIVMWIISLPFKLIKAIFKKRE